MLEKYEKTAQKTEMPPSFLKKDLDTKKPRPLGQSLLTRPLNHKKLIIMLKKGQTTVDPRSSMKKTPIIMQINQ